MATLKINYGPGLCAPKSFIKGQYYSDTNEKNFVSAVITDNGKVYECRIRDYTFKSEEYDGEFSKDIKGKYSLYLENDNYTLTGNLKKLLGCTSFKIVIGNAEQNALKIEDIVSIKVYEGAKEVDSWKVNSGYMVIEWAKNYK